MKYEKDSLGILKKTSEHLEQKKFHSSSVIREIHLSNPNVLEISKKAINLPKNKEPE